MSESQVYCFSHNAGPYNQGSEQNIEHEKTSDAVCNWQEYNPQLHNPVYDQSELNKNSPDKEPDPNVSEKLYKFTKPLIKKLVTSDIDVNDVYMLVKNNSHFESLNLDSSKTKHWMRNSYFEATGENYPDGPYDTALSLIKSQAIMTESNKEQIYNRIAMPDNKTIYYDLADKKWRTVKITKDKVTIIQLDETCPIFTRKQHQKEQVIPIFDEKKDALSELITLLRIMQKDKLVFKVHLISFFLESCPIPIMPITGEHGSIKTTIAKSVKQIVDPSGEGISSLPKNDEIILHLNNRYVANFDNISEFNREMSDILCRAITGEGQSKRALYTNSDEVIYSYRRKIILNGISPTLEHPDLRDRCIVYETEPLAPHERLTEEEFQMKFNALVPHVLGQIFQTLSKALGNYDSVKKELKNKPRMADFAIFGESISRGLGNDPFAFITNYQEHVDFNDIDVLESYPIIQLIEEVMENKDTYENNISSFYRDILQRAESNGIEIKSRDINFPKAPNKVKQHIERLKPNLRTLGFSIQIDTYAKRDGVHPRNSRIIHIQTINELNSLDSKVSNVSLPSLPSLSNENQAHNTSQIDRHTDKDKTSDKDNKEDNNNESLSKTKEISHENTRDRDDSDDRDSFSTIGQQGQDIACKDCSTVYKNTTISLETIQKIHSEGNPNHTLYFVEAKS